MTDLAIETDGLTKQFDDELAVEDLTLQVPEGSIYGFLGPNGAGKTTTMRLLTSLTAPTSGTATVADVPVADRPALAPKIGYLPTDPPVFEELTGREQLHHVARLHGLDDETRTERVRDHLERFDLQSAADRRVASYSTGMRKKLGLIGAVLHDPDVVLFDEPTSGLDPRAARTVRDTVAEMTTRDVTVFLSTHILDVVEELADSVGVIDDGVLVAEGSPEELKARKEDGAHGDLEDVFLQVTGDADERTARSDREVATAGSEDVR
ncbi:ABC transporter ATP-binding protein [Halorubellus litoreus]|uniref:ABC transporter ATP-binding protein n=1 Tax=Halorubellus litoreus TaxID=755308 RepID=A0ABD5VA06_9EURY